MIARNFVLFLKRKLRAVVVVGFSLPWLPEPCTIFRMRTPGDDCAMRIALRSSFSTMSGWRGGWATSIVITGLAILLSAIL
jgi:hypothetical protein